MVENLAGNTMISSPLTLIVNLSLRSVRVVVFSELGEKVYEDWLPIRTYVNESSVEQDPNEWWELLVVLLKKVFSQEDLKNRIKYLTVTSSAMCLVMVDNKGNVLEKSMMVSDKRAQEESKLFLEKFPDFFDKEKSIKAEPGFMLPKIVWLKKNNPKIFKKTAKFMSSNDFLLFKLTGEFVTDTLNAEKFYYSQKSKDYPNKLLELAGISVKQLPRVTNLGSTVGFIIPQVQKEMKSKQKITVFLSTYDAICSLIGSSTFTEGELNNVCGTCSSYRMFLKEVPDKKHHLLVQHMSSEDLFIVGASNNLEGGVLEWAKECFYGDNYLKDDDFLYSLMQTEAKESELGANGIVFLPYLMGERMPFSDPDVRGSFFGIERFHSRKDIIRSIFEAVSFQAKLMLEEFEKNGFTLSSVTMSGGMSKMPFAAQMRADILGLPVNVLSEVETTALGAFILTLRARKKLKNIKDVEKLVSIKQTYLPNMHNHNCYASLYILYKQLYTEQREMFKKRKEILKKISHYRKKVLENL